MAPAGSRYPSCPSTQLRHGSLVLTALLGSLDADLLGYVVPRWEAEGGAVGPSLTAVVELDPQHGVSQPGTPPLSEGVPVLVHGGVRGGLQVHRRDIGHVEMSPFR